MSRIQFIVAAVVAGFAVAIISAPVSSSTDRGGAAPELSARMPIEQILIMRDAEVVARELSRLALR